MFEKTLKTHYLLNLFIRRNPQKAGLAGFYGWCNFIIIFFLFLDFIYGTITNAVFSEHIFREVPTGRSLKRTYQILFKDVSQSKARDFAQRELKTIFIFSPQKYLNSSMIILILKNNEEGD